MRLMSGVRLWIVFGLAMLVSRIGAAGVTGNYYALNNQSTLLLSRTDADINFNWGSGAPGPGVPSEQFFVRWTGRLTSPQTGTYTFRTLSDDGIRLWINNQLVV